MAVVGPLGGDFQPVSEDDEFPIDLEDNEGAIVRHFAAPEAGEEREMVVFETIHGLEAVFLPDGLTEECLLIDEVPCDFSSTINAVLTTGVYKIVVWNRPSAFERQSTMPHTRPIDMSHDVVLMSGFKEEDVRKKTKTNTLTH